MSDTMNQVVMCYSVGDGCTYHCDVTLPIFYESPEQALVDFEKLCIAAHEAPWQVSHGTFVFCGTEFNESDFYEKDVLYLPSFLTVDEWFDQQASQA